MRVPELALLRSRLQRLLHDTQEAKYDSPTLGVRIVRQLDGSPVGTPSGRHARVELMTIGDPT
jgi:hypothetical protein